MYRKSRALHGETCAVIGGAGFIGSHIVDAAIESGATEVLVYDDLSRGTLDNLSSSVHTRRVRVVQGDIRDLKLLCAELKGMTYVFHQAAVHLRRCESHPREALEINEVGSFNVAEACVTNKVKKLIAASSSSVYGEGFHLPTPESHPLSTKLFYGAAKVGAEKYYEAFHQKYGLSFVGLRYLNVYGPRQDSQGAYTEIIGSFLNAIAAGARPIIHGDGKQTLDMIFVRDVANANLAALDANVNCGFFNVASGLETTVLGLYDLLCEMCDVWIEPCFEPDDVKRVQRRFGATTTASRVLGFSAETPLKQGLREVIDWYRRREETQSLSGGPRT